MIVLLPTLNAMGPEALPLATVTPFTFMVEFASVDVGVTVIEVTVLATDDV